MSYLLPLLITVQAAVEVNVMTPGWRALVCFVVDVIRRNLNRP